MQRCRVWWRIASGSPATLHIARSTKNTFWTYKRLDKWVGHPTTQIWHRVAPFIRYCFHEFQKRPHTAHLTLVKIGRYGRTLMSHSAYNSDLTSSDFNLFKRLKSFLRGKTLKDANFASSC
ncbi:hypothetical protein LAZ67_19002682 [Cordylochernes scorpioides]|uniref:Uncharacterized protein n=1 Tax=Cordylochernes scorpioides TaxID=51811 RepID=A0ABY6LLA2_9ARAC|nr:hypothetical protein LAZ67_19002682 [Cordylochernes scorpioides]